MKNKPTRHKETNTFKFQPFSERISQLDVDVFHRIGHKNEEYNEEETFFHQTLHKWNVLNLSEGYDEFRKELPCVETLPLLLNQRELVIGVVLKHLSKRNPLTLEAILDLLAALMKDLRHEVYSSYGVILQKLCELLTTKNADELEWIFTCLAYMFKYLWRYIVKDVDTVFDSLVPLFSDRKPQYIKNFAAESFAYVVRKVKNKKDFIKLIIRTLESRTDGVEGCGQLMFEVMRGIRGRFHSFAQDFLPLVMEILYDSSVNSKLLYDLLKSMVSAMCGVIEPKYLSLFWSSTFNVIYKYDKGVKENAESQVLILKLIKQVVDHKQGVLLTDPQYVIPNILKLLDNVEEKNISGILSEIVASVLLSPNIHLLQDNARQLTSKMLMVSYEQTVIDFIHHVLLYPGFETFVLPWVQSYVCRTIQKSLDSSFLKSETTLNETVLKLLSQIVLKKCAPSLDGVGLEIWRKYPIDLTIVSKDGPNMKVPVFETLFQESCNTFSFESDNIEELLCILLVLPHVNLIHEEIVFGELKKLMTKLCSLLHNGKELDENILQKLLFAFLILLESQIHLMDFQIIEKNCTIEFVVDLILPLAKEPAFISALSIVDLYLTAMKLEVQNKHMTQQLMEKVYLSLFDNLSSPYHKVRYLTTHILSLFVTTGSENVLNFVKTCFDVECCTVSLHNVRDKLLLLEKLSFDVIEAEDIYLEIPLRFLLGVLYENFQLLWEPVMHLIASYARGMAVPRFWQVFKAHLEQSVQNIDKFGNTLENNCSFINLSLTEVYNSLYNFDDKPDYSNYRILLWKSLAEFPELCEMKSKDVSPLFLNFLEEEYFKEHSSDMQFYSVKLPKSIDNEKNDAELLENSMNKKKKNDNRTKHAQLYQTLLAKLRVFAKLRHPKNVYKEPQLTMYYFNLLTHKNSIIQKMALDCLMAYKETYLMPYKEHLYGLLDDKMFKSEMAVFHIDQENSIVQEEHRAALLPVVIRILYGRMLTKTGRGSNGKGAAELRQSLVLRFLSGCNDNEMIFFLKLAFKVYLPYFHDNIKIMIEDIMKSVDLNNVISLKILRSSLNFMLVVIEKFGGLMGNEVLSFVLHVLICIGSLISGILAHKSEIYTGYASGVRSLQSTSILAGTKFFSQFSDFPWTSEDLDAFFSVFVWPGLEKLPMEGIHSPTALLKLLASWTRNPKYFNLLEKSKDCDSDTPISAVVKLLAAPKIQPSVTRAILDMFEALLTTADSDEVISEKLEFKELNHSKMLFEDLNYGSKILLPHVPAIIQHLQQKLVIRKRKGLSPRDLLILSRVCELVVDADTSESLLKLLFLAFHKKVNGPEETVIHLVSTIYNLMKNVSAPFKYLKSIAPLFGTVTSISARKMLCDMLTELVKGSELDQDVVSENVHLLLDINAWDAKWVEQPDFGRRLEGFKSSYEMIEKEKLRVDFGLILVHNCFYFLKYEKDLALKDSSAYCLRKLSPYLCKQAMLTKNTHVPDTILKLIAAGIREKSNENLHDEAITLLGELVRESDDTHPTLLDLKELASKEDPEVDFFNNIIHLQSHRRAKALMKFCSVAKLMVKTPRIQTLSQFILPFVSSFLCSEKYANKANVVDAAVLSIGIVCKFLPWFHYETVLKYYLRKLHSVPAFQKQLVRVVVSILDGFHFDVSCAKEIFKINKDEKLNSNNFSEERKDTQELEKISIESNELKEEADTENTKLTPGNLRSEEGEEVMKEKDVSESITNTKDDADIDTELSLEEELEEAMDNVDDEKVEMESRDILSTPNEEPFILRRIKLCTTAATRVIQAIVGGLLPLLQRTFSQHKISERVHKTNRKKTAAEQEEEDTMCIPLALAIVKLLQQLPSQYLDQNLPHIFLSICNYLKSRMESVRRVAREMLQKIMANLGPAYLGILLNEMRALLSKGFHIHVLIFTIHSILSSMKLTFKAGDMDACVSQILDICKMDLFGQASEEKNVKKITGKVSEARSHKSYDTLKIAAQYVTEKCFIDLLLPFKEVLVASNSYSLVVRVSESLHRIVFGLYDNTFVSVESLLIFIYGVASGSIDALKMNSEQKKNCEENSTSMPVKRPDSFLIPQAPRTRYGAITAKPKISSDRNAHVLVEFGFKLLYILLKRGKATADGFAMYIDPLLPVLEKSIDTQHVMLTTTTLNCFVNVLKMDLPNLRKNIDAISISIFNLLHKYATSAQSQGEYQDMVIAAFKAMTVLVRDVKYHVINELQLKALLLYVENDMQIFSKQSTAFPLLKAILSRKLDIPEVYQVMSKVAKLSIVSDHENVRSQARLVFYNFLMNYPLGAKVNKYVDFYVLQLSYELETGRISAFQIIHRMIATFPDNVLSKYSGVLFVAIGAALVNDDSPSCKKMAAKCLKTLISRNEKDRDKLFGFTLVWLKEQKIAHRTLGAQICGIFVEVETDSFLRHLKDLLPVLQNQLSAKMNFMYAPGKSVRLIQDSNESEETREKKLKLEDHCIFQVLRLIKKICSLCPSFLSDSCWMSDVDSIGDAAQHLMGHPHEWIRLEAAAVLGHIFASLDIKALVETVTSSSYIEGQYLFNETGGKLKSLVLDFCDQLVPIGIGPQLIEQVTKNLAFLSRVLQAFPEDVELPEENGVKISLLWMVRRMRKIVNMEIVQTPSSYILREAVFKWIGALVVDLNRERLQSIITQVLAPLARELFNEEESNPDLLRLARGVTKIIKKKLGMEEYTKQLSKLQVHLATRRAVRKRERAQEFIHNPDIAAKRKIKKHQKKKLVKKRKIDEWKGRIAPKIKRKLNNISDFELSVPNKKWIITESDSH